MEKNCQNCNRPNSSDAAFCRYCATPFSNSAEANKQANFNQPPPPQNQQWNQPQNFGNQHQNPANQSGTGNIQKGMIAVGLVVVGLVCCGPFTGIPAAILGWMEMTAIKEGRSPKDSMWMAQVGLWGGIVVSIIGTIAGFFMLLLSAASGSGY